MAKVVSLSRRLSSAILRTDPANPRVYISGFARPLQEKNIEKEASRASDRAVDAVKEGTTVVERCGTAVSHAAETVKENVKGMANKASETAQEIGAKAKEVVKDVAK